MGLLAAMPLTACAAPAGSAASLDRPTRIGPPPEPAPALAARTTPVRPDTPVGSPEKHRRPAPSRSAVRTTEDPTPLGALPKPAARAEPVEVAPGAPEPDGPVWLVSGRQGEDPPADVAAAILGAYTAFWDSYWAAAVHPVNPDHPGIGRHSTEPLRSRAVGVLMGRAAEGIALRLPAGHGTGRVLHIEGWDAGSAEVLDCFVDTAVLYEVSTARVRNDEQATVVHLALMRREGDTWRVAEIFEQAIHTGRTDGCIVLENRSTTLAPAAPLPPARDGTGVAGAPQSP